MLASTSPRPAKRPRRSSDSGDMLFCPPRKWAVPAPILLRKLDPTTVITKCLEAVANERLLRGSDLIDRIITDQFLALNELQNRNNTNVKEAKNFICKHIGPILYQVINQYLESFTQDGDVISLSENSQSPIQPKKQKSDGENAPLEVSTATNSKPERKMPPLFTSQMESLGSLGVTAGEAAHTTIDHPSGAGIGGWLAGDSPYPFRKNYPVQSSSINGIPVENIQASGKSQWPHPERSKSDAGVLEDNISMANSSPVKTKLVIARAQSISGKLGGDHQETRSIVSNSRKKASQAVRSCTFCYKELPSPSARKHGRDGRSRGTSLSELLIDHGPLSDERMAALRQQYHMERSEGVNLTTANFGFATPSIKTTDRDLQTDRDELASQHNTIISMDYSYTGNTAIQPHMPTHISSSLFAGLGSAYDDSNSLIMRGELDQASQADYAMNEFIPYRNSIGQFPPNSFLPQGPQLVGVGAVHAGSSLTNIPSTIDVDEDAQGENDLEWSENLVVNTMKGG
ncbi:hypothetical protein AOL_s00007g104 [Orbilia oligospora ATCC 24927]|uniref:Uncharacterized protein n=1 Tax=Arthrobotrys oligospora (strain ATCC 24927 / CBS 115.81 / DSM 1491) TaxID=756982 RepID=G1X1E5_ARTOA|nr:hypothetical protein AOL_s00007g104 [Orbilia oligospora ATCC 24927]EGX52768.1 hypothetical protein AOL_s00007g104 [Orbilia oligospora ATCC 24927]